MLKYLSQLNFNLMSKSTLNHPFNLYSPHFLNYLYRVELYYINYFHFYCYTTVSVENNNIFSSLLNYINFNIFLKNYFNFFKTKSNTVLKHSLNALNLLIFNLK